MSMYCVNGRRCCKMKTSPTPRPFRRSCFEPTFACPTYPFFLQAGIPINSQSSESHSLNERLQKKKHKNLSHCTFDPTDDKKGSYSQSSRKNNRSETGFFQSVFPTAQEVAFGLQSGVGDKPVDFQVSCPHDGRAVLKRLISKESVDTQEARGMF